MIGLGGILRRFRAGSVASLAPAVKWFHSSSEEACLSLRNGMNRIQHSETMMRVKEEDLILLPQEEIRKHPIVKSFLTND